jgi:hypothetical protein
VRVSLSISHRELDTFSLLYIMASASSPSSTATPPVNLVEVVTSPLLDDGSNNFHLRSRSHRPTVQQKPSASAAAPESGPGAQTRTSQEIQIKERNHVHDYENFFKNLGAIATLGSSITFSLIVSKIQDPIEVSKKAGTDQSVVKILLAVTWLLFTVLLAVAFLVSGLVKMRLDKFNELNAFLHFVFSMIFLLIAAATVFLSLVLGAYVEVLGWVGLSIFVFVAAVGQYWYLASAVFGKRFGAEEAILNFLIGT